MTIEFENRSFSKRLTSMLSVDFKRMFTMPLIYILIGASLVIPILILVMTTAMPSTTIDPVTGLEKEIETFTNTWQAIATVSGDSQGAMSLVSMCNINMMYFAVAVLVCIFVADDFRSGYAKNLFTMRAQKTDYVISKTLVCFVGGAFMFVAYFIGTMLGGAIAGLPFDLGGAGVSGLIMCLISKICLIALFVSIFLIASVFARQKLWLSIILSLGIGMLFFMVIPIVSPLDSGILQVCLSLFGGAIFSVGLGAISNLLLNKISLV